MHGTAAEFPTPKCVSDLPLAERVDIALKLNEMRERATDRMLFISAMILAIKLFKVNPSVEAFLGPQFSAANKSALIGVLGWALVVMVWRAGRYYLLCTYVHDITGLAIGTTDGTAEQKTLKKFLVGWAFFAGLPATIMILSGATLAIWVSWSEMISVVQLMFLRG
jgi:hypothetical protein